MDSDRELGFTAAAELLARRWTEDRPYFTLNQGASGLHAWLRRLGSADLELPGSQVTPWRCAWMQDACDAIGFS
jgi:hypothetical protein